MNAEQTSDNIFTVNDHGKLSGDDFGDRIIISF